MLTFSHPDQRALTQARNLAGPSRSLRDFLWSSGIPKALLLPFIRLHAAPIVAQDVYPLKETSEQKRGALRSLFQ